MKAVYVNQQKIALRARQAIAKGGEADIYDLGQGTVLKLFKPPTHPDYQGQPAAQQAARDRLAQHQQKLRQFPTGLPPQVVAPQALATDHQGQIVGYTMPRIDRAEPLLRYSDRGFRRQGITTPDVVQIFQKLHDLVTKLHFAGVVIGDFNDLNVLVQGTTPYLIDADSFQFGPFPCTVFTARFVDPLRCAPHGQTLQLAQPPNEASDWYAFTVMLMQCLLFVNPYGGVYRPQDPQNRLPQAARPRHRITIFHPEVRYPKPALPYTILPDDWQHHFRRVFEQDWRGEFPQALLTQLPWQTCPSCGAAYARQYCPHCAPTVPSRGQTAHAVKGKVIATTVFQTAGVILAATTVAGPLHWLYHDQGAFRREDGTVVLTGDRHPHLRWHLQGATTWLGYQGLGLALRAGESLQRLAVDGCGPLTQLATNAQRHYWLHQGQLQSATLTALQPTIMGAVLPDRTRFWVGPRFGLGFYSAGELTVAFVFDAVQPGLRDRVPWPTPAGQLMAAHCVFSDTLAWCFLTHQINGQVQRQVVVVQADGAIAATVQAQAGDAHWLNALGTGSPCAVGSSLLAATDDGILRIDYAAGQLQQPRPFPDTEPWVQQDTHLLPARDGLYAVTAHTIHQLQLSSSLN